MNWKRIGCILKGGCKFDMAHSESHHDMDTDMLTIKQTCTNCGKTYVYHTNYSKMVRFAEYVRDNLMK